MSAATAITLSPFPVSGLAPTTITEWAVVSTTLHEPTHGDATPAPTAIMDAGASYKAPHWYEAGWTEAATWLLLAYCAISVLLLWGLCTGGCLDNRLSLDFSVQTRRARRRERQERDALRSRALLRQWADMAPDEHALHTARLIRGRRTQQRNDSTTSIVTELGQGDEAELAEIQRTFAAHGVHVSERHLREQRRAYARSASAQSRQMDVQPSPTQDNITGIGTIRHFHRTHHNDSGDNISVEYAAELERHRQYRQSRMRDAEFQRNMTPRQRRRYQQNMQIEANLRAIGLI